MPAVFSVEVKAQPVLRLFNDLQFKLPREASMILLDIAKLGQRNIRYQLTKNKTVWRGKLWGSINARMINKQNSIVAMSKEGLYLDRMTPHYVKLKRGRLIQRWALMKGAAGVQAVARRQGSIYVRPHPFIDVSVAKTINGIDRILMKRLNRAIGA